MITDSAADPVIWHCGCERAVYKGLVSIKLK